MKRKIICIALFTFSLIGCSNQDSDKIEVVYNVNYTNGNNRVEYIRKNAKPFEWKARRKGYVLDYWSIDSSLNSEFDFSKPLKENTTLYAKWINESDIHYYDINFDYNYEGCPLPKTYNLRSYTKLSKIEIPEVQRLGYEFDGWYFDRDGMNVVDVSNFIVNGDLTLYASYTKNDNLNRDSEENVVFNNQEINVVVNNDWGGYKNSITTLANEFNELYEGRIKVNITSSDETAQLLFTQTEIINRNEEKYYNMNEVLSLLNIEFDRNDFYTNAINDCYIGDVLKVMPIGNAVPYLVYNKKLLNKYGGIIPTNYNELIELLKEVQDGEKGNPNFYASMASDFGWSFNELSSNIFYIQNDALAYEYNNGSYFTNWKENGLNAYRSAFSFYGGMNPLAIAEGDYSSANGMNGLKEVGKGNALFGLIGTCGSRTYLEQGCQKYNSELYKDIGVMPLSNMFAVEENSKSNYIFTKSYSAAVVKDEDNEDIYKILASGVFADYVSKNMLLLAKNYLCPTRKSIYEGSSFKKNIDPAIKFVLQNVGDPNNFYTYSGTTYEYAFLANDRNNFYLFDVMKMNDFVDEDISMYVEIVNDLLGEYL